MDPMIAAIKQRRAHHLNASQYASPAIDDSKLPEQAGSPQRSDADQDSLGDRKRDEGDLAPEAHPDLQSDLLEHEENNPEHSPALRGDELDPMGHELSPEADPSLDVFMMDGHNPDLSKPKTLGARVRAALQSKKGMK